MSLSPEFIRTSLQGLYGESVAAADIRAWCAMNGANYQTVTNKLTDYKTSRGKWNLTVQEKLEQTYQAPTAMPAVEQNLIPAKDDTFVSFGNFADIKKIIKSGLFYPTFITGLSGNGKTFSVEQACSQTKRELIRVNITIETDEDDLIGGFGLVDGNTAWHDGPVVEAMRRGAVLLLDEVDHLSGGLREVSQARIEQAMSMPEQQDGNAALKGAAFSYAAASAFSTSEGNFTGYVHVYELINGVWSRIVGISQPVGTGSSSGPIIGELYGTSQFSYTGLTVALSGDGNILAVSSPGEENFRGVVRVYNWNGNNWNQLGSDIVGLYNFGFSGRGEGIVWIAQYKGKEDKLSLMIRKHLDHGITVSSSIANHEYPDRYQ